MDIVALARAGTDALRVGDARLARSRFEQVIQAGGASLSVWKALAAACRQTGDIDAMLHAADKALSIDPTDISCLMLKGDHFAAQGDDRAALSFYNAVIGSAGRQSTPTPEVLLAQRRANEMSENYMAKMLRHVSDSLAAAGFIRGKSSERFAQAVDLLSGAKRTYYQEPRMFYFPELPQVQFCPRSQCPWLDRVEAATDDICAELRAILSGDEFAPYLRGDATRAGVDWTGLIDKQEWSAFFLWKDGAPVVGNVERFPKTMAALADVPLTRIKGRTPSILFSRLLPGARIPPHHGMLNSRYICHLPLIIPPGCRFRVGNDQREWVKGKAWAFDDSIEHEAHNQSRETRIVLIFEAWRPELTDEERKLVATVVEAVDTYSGDARMKWDN